MTGRQERTDGISKQQGIVGKRIRKGRFLLVVLLVLPNHDIPRGIIFQFFSENLSVN